MTKRDSVLDLAGSDEALGLYLDALLRDVGEETATPVVSVKKPLTVTSTSPRGSSVVVQVDATEAVPVAIRSRDIQVKVESKIESKVAASPAVAANPAPTSAPSKITPTIPTEPFQALLFQVAGLTVAVPLVDLNGILNYPERLAAVPGLPTWGLGVVRYRETNVIAVDGITLFVPDHLQVVARTRSVPRYLVLLGESRFGLVCESVDQVVQLRPDEVRWRGERGRRPWLAGTVKDRLCALLEVPALVQLLEAGRIESPAK